MEDSHLISNLGQHIVSPPKIKALIMLKKHFLFVFALLDLDKE